MSRDFRFLLLSAMYENGGNVTHRHLDGHPQMFVYPFESQLGTRHVTDGLASLFPVKYRWPVFSLTATPEEDFRAIIDEELKVRTRTPHVSKFRHVPMELSDEERRQIYCRLVEESGRARGSNVAAFFRATFDAWKDYQRTGQEIVYVGYSPVIVVDAEKVLRDHPRAHVLHVVRNPWSAYADTKKRPVPLSLHDYVFQWVVNQYHALLYREKYPDRVHVVRLEDVLDDPAAALEPICEKLGVAPSDSLKAPTWNRSPLTEVFPWGTIRSATPAANRATAGELSAEERGDIRSRTRQYLETFDYGSFVAD
jgi:hypothetical protein